MSSIAASPVELSKVSRSERVAMTTSFTVSVLLLATKWAAYALTGSVAVLSDAAESVVHVAAVAFAAWSLKYAQKPADRGHLYGHDKITFFAAGAEGMLVAFAGAAVFITAVRHLIEGYVPEKLTVGIVLAALVAVVNGMVGWWIQRIGRLTGSLILVAHGRHVASDAITSGGVLVALTLVKFSGWYLLDPMVGVAIALYLAKSGYEMVRTSLGGLMDESSPELDARLRAHLDAWADRTGGQYHELRHRRSGRTTWIEVHLLLPGATTLEEAHRIATKLERELHDLAGGPAVVTTHVEPLETHEEHHMDGSSRGQSVVGSP